jgi:hypothetical protein
MNRPLGPLIVFLHRVECPSLDGTTTEGHDLFLFLSATYCQDTTPRGGRVGHVANAFAVWITAGFWAEPRQFRSVRPRSIRK